MATHVALLRGVNVGGRKLAMSDLREILTSLGHTDVSTYIQSGNALFTPADASDDGAALAGRLEKAIDERLGMTVGVVVLSRDDLAMITRDNPYMEEPNPKCVHAIALSAPLDAELLSRVEALATAAAASSRDTVRYTSRSLYLHTPDGFGHSDLAQRLMRLLGSPRCGVVATARNWSTMMTLLARLDQ